MEGREEWDEKDRKANLAFSFVSETGTEAGVIETSQTEERSMGNFFKEVVERAASRQDPKEGLEIEMEDKRKVIIFPTKVDKLETLKPGYLISPTIFCRSALFSVSKKKKLLRDELIVAVDGHKLKAHGAQLDQAVFDLYLKLLRMCPNATVGQTIHTTRYELTKALGLSDNGQNNRRVWLRLKDLNSTSIELETPSGSKISSPLVLVAAMNAEGRIAINLAPHWSSLFSGFVVYHEDKKRAEFKTDLGKWMYGYVRSQLPNAHTVKYETLHKLSGSAIKELKSFKRDLLKVMNQLREADVITGYDKERDPSLLSFWFTKGITGSA